MSAAPVSSHPPVIQTTVTPPDDVKTLESTDKSCRVYCCCIKNPLRHQKQPPPVPEKAAARFPEKPEVRLEDIIVETLT